MLQRKIFPVACALIALVLLSILFSPMISSMRPGVTIPQSYMDSLTGLQEIALQHGEYPTAALIVYGDSIIGAGFNTFRDLNNPTGHAEINAIHDVFNSMHYMEFRALDRDSLVLVSSYEPCMMCKGVINHLDIRKIYYVRPKEIRTRLKYQFRDLSYYLKMRRVRSPDIQ